MQTTSGLTSFSKKRLESSKRLAWRDGMAHKLSTYFRRFLYIARQRIGLEANFLKPTTRA